MNNLNTQLEDLKKSLRIQTAMFIFVIILGSFGCLVSYNLGRIRHEREIIERAKKLPENVDCYTNADVEKLIFNESQL